MHWRIKVSLRGFFRVKIMKKDSGDTKTVKYKVDYNGAEKLALEGLAYVRNMDSIPSVKAQKERRLGSSCIIKLKGRKSRKEGNTASVSYFNREVTKLRTAIKQHGFIRHDFNDKIKALANEYPLVSDDLLKLVDVHYKEAKDLKTTILNKIHGRILKSKKGSKKEDLKKSHSKLKKISFEPVFFETLIRSTEQKDELKENAEDRMELYHTMQRSVDYGESYKRMAKFLSADIDWRALTLGLAFACGRRFSEIISYQDGEFSKTKNNNEAAFLSNVKTKESKKYTIPLLVDFEAFIVKLERLRSMKEIKAIIEKYKHEENYDIRHRAMNHEFSYHLNKFVRDNIGEEWCFKDSRAVYARIAYTEYSIKEKAKGKLPITDDLFFKQKLGHTDSDTQQNYKRFQVVDAPAPKETIALKKEAKEQSKVIRNRLTELTELLEQDSIQERRAFVKYSAFVIEQVKADPKVKLTSTLIKNELGGNKGIISEFARIIKEAGLQKPV